MMGEENVYHRTADLIEALVAAQRDLEQGRLDLHGLDHACDTARELYERLVVVRHKVREQRTPGRAAPAASQEPIRLDTRPTVLPGQTSLIDAIAATEQEQSATATRPVKDLAKAISLNHKFWFTAELFNGDRQAYEQAIARLNAAPDKASALDMLREEVMARLDKEPDAEALAAFTELLERRFA